MTLSINSQNPLRMPVSPLQMLLLIQLDGGPKYGYEMLITLKEEFVEIWEPKTGTVYPALKSLEKKGYITTETRDNTQYYFITEFGKEIFDQMLRHIDGSIDFSIKYLSVVFKWLTNERKQGALQFMDKLTIKEETMSNMLLGSFTQNIDPDIREILLKKVRENSQNRLNKINKILEKQ